MAFMTRIVGAAALGAALLIGSGLFAPPAQAAFTVTLTQEGPNVVAAGSGTINTTDLRFMDAGSALATVSPFFAHIDAGPNSALVAVYSDFSGPTNFGNGPTTFENTGSGDFVGINGFLHVLSVPFNYLSGSSLRGTSTYYNVSFSSLGIMLGTYVWTWGSGANADSFTVKTSVPEPATLGLMVLGLLGAAFGQKRRN